MDRLTTGEGLVSVVVDGELGGYKATRYLIDKGHRSIAYISGPTNSYDKEFVQPPLTTIRQPMYDSGSLAGHLLFQLLNNEQVHDSYKLKVELIERQSVQTVASGS